MSDQQAPKQQGGGGRRIATRANRTATRISPVLAAGLVAVLVAATALAGMRGSDEAAAEPVHEAQYRPLATQDLSCPAAPGDGASLVVGRLAGDPDDRPGSISARPAAGGTSQRLEIDPGSAESVRVSNGPVVLAGRGGGAPGLVAARVKSSGVPGAAECVAPSAETWFNGAGAGGLHESTLLLVNPDRGPAVADVTLWTTTGLVDAPTIRGLTVEGGSSVEVDLAEVAPTREELTVRVAVSRGRIAATMADAYTPRGGSQRRDGLPASAAPARDLVIPAMPRKSTEATLVLANPGESAARVRLSVVGAEAEFEPQGLGEIRVAGGQVSVQELPDEVVELLSAEDVSLRLVATEPVTGGLRAVTSRDFSHFPALAPVRGDVAAVVPSSGRRTLVVGATGSAARVELQFVGAKGDQATTALRLRPGLSSAVRLPPGTRAVVVRTSGRVTGAVRTVTDSGTSLVPLRPVVTRKLIPDVRPEW